MWSLLAFMDPRLDGIPAHTDDLDTKPLCSVHFLQVETMMETLSCQIMSKLCFVLKDQLPPSECATAEFWSRQQQIRHN